MTVPTLASVIADVTRTGKPMIFGRNDKPSVIVVPYDMWKTTEAAAKTAATPPPVGAVCPLARKTDPARAKAGAVMAEPVRNSRRAKVLDRLRASNGGWVTLTELSLPDVGSSGADRRLRELIEDGWPIERQRLSGNLPAGYAQYRLRPDRLAQAQ